MVRYTASLQRSQYYVVCRCEYGVRPRGAISREAAKLLLIGMLIEQLVKQRVEPLTRLLATASVASRGCEEARTSRVRSEMGGRATRKNLVTSIVFPFPLLLGVATSCASLDSTVTNDCIATNASASLTMDCSFGSFGLRSRACL